MRDILPTLERWIEEGLDVATATLVAVERSAPREPGAALAVTARGDVAGSVTAGCVEPALYEEAKAVLAGAPPRLVTYGIADDEAFEVGLPCGGTVHVFVDRLDPALVAPLAAAVRDERPAALAVTVSGPEAGTKRFVEDLGELDLDAADLAARGESGLADGGDVFVASFAPRPRLYVFGAVDHAAALATVGRLLGYHVTVCDARARFVTRERIPDADELVVDWPDRFLEQAPVDGRTAICVLTHDRKFDVPALRAALRTPAGYIGAMGSSRTSAARAELLRAAGMTEAELERIHAPIGVDVGSRTPAEVAVAVGAQLVAAARGRLPARGREALAR